MEKKKNPWKQSKKVFINNIELTPQVVSVQDRIMLLQKFDRTQLKQAIGYPGTQKTVRIAAERLLRKKIKSEKQSL